MKRRLHQTRSSGAALLRAIHYCLHQLPSDAQILCGGVDRNRANPDDDAALIQAITPDDPATAFRHYAVASRGRKNHREQSRGSFR